MPSLNPSKETVSPGESEQLARRLITCINGWSGLPAAVAASGLIYKPMPPKTVSMGLFPMQGTYITDWDILGNRDAEYRFRLLYRVRPGGSQDVSLQADEVLDALGEWLQGQCPELGPGRTATDIRPSTRAFGFDTDINGDEDHQIVLVMRYHMDASAPD